MLVERVGDRTFLGEISDEVQTDTRESPLKLRLTRLAGQISRMGYLAAALVALIFLLNAFLFDTGFDRAVILARLSDWRWSAEYLLPCRHAGAYRTGRGCAGRTAYDDRRCAVLQHPAKWYATRYWCANRSGSRRQEA